MGWGGKERRIRLNGFRSEESNSSVSLIAQLLCHIVSFFRVSSSRPQRYLMLWHVLACVLIWSRMCHSHGALLENRQGSIRTPLNMVDGVGYHA